MADFASTRWPLRADDPTSTSMVGGKRDAPGRVIQGSMLMTLGVSSLLACDPASDETRPAQEEFENAYAQFSEQHAGKADVFDGLGADPCLLLEPLAANARPFLRSGLVVGTEVEGTTGLAKGFYGRDMVWDAYHHQMTISRYRGAGLTSGIAVAGAGATVYVGAAYNFEDGVADWNGHFVTASASFGADLELPFVAELEVAAVPSVFVSAVDEDGNGVIDGPSEVTFPGGVFGFTAGVSASASLVPLLDPIPLLDADVSLTQGVWEPDHDAIRTAYEQLEKERVFGAFRLDVRLVDRRTGTDCLAANSRWPQESPEYDGPDLDCVVELGNPSESHTSRSVDVAASMCSLTGGCELPLTWSLASTAIAVGFARDLGQDVASRCGFDDSTPPA